MVGPQPPKYGLCTSTIRCNTLESILWFVIFGVCQRKGATEQTYSSLVYHLGRGLHWKNFWWGQMFMFPSYYQTSFKCKPLSHIMCKTYFFFFFIVSFIALKGLSIFSSDNYFLLPMWKEFLPSPKSHLWSECCMNYILFIADVQQDSIFHK